MRDLGEVLKVLVGVGAALVATGCATEDPAPRLDPQLQAVLDAHRDLGAIAPYEVSLDEARRGVTVADAVVKVLADQGVTYEPERMAQVRPLEIPGPAGALEARVYVPAAPGPLAVIVFFHDGGFVLGSLDEADTSGRALSNEVGAIVVSVHVRLAPEHPHPAPVDDAFAAYRWVREHAGALGGDPVRVAIAGEGSGANLATVVAMRLAAADDAPPRAQLLVQPFLSNDLTSPSHLRNEEPGYVVRNQDLSWYWQLYLAPGWREVTDPEAVPLHAPLAGLASQPPTVIVTSGLDPLEDEGTAYAAHLAAAGVEVEHLRYPGVTHAVLAMGPVVDQARAARADIGRAMRVALAP